VADRISRLCKGVKVAVAHGQLEGDKLEDVMMRFIEGEYDVLVATTIIESGLDISNANTIIINNAHMFGLSDLHQMRGRVGRSNKKAFCYLLVPSMSSLSVDSRRRLQAIEEFSDLGSGFNVAMRDLDIRGAGNLLGGEQSGFIAEIGFEMFNKILDEAIQELKEDEFAEVFNIRVSGNDNNNGQNNKRLTASNGVQATNNTYQISECAVETDFEALIPDAYIRNIGERLSLYNHLSSISSDTDLEKFANDLKDRFGPIPKQVFDLIELIKLREIARQLGFERLVMKSNNMSAYFPDEKKQSYYQSDLFSGILQFVQHNPMLCKLKQSPKTLILQVMGVNDIKIAKNLLERIKKHTSKE
jgi:transcription-repair coupling factor (superfamily II helicase)